MYNIKLKNKAAQRIRGPGVVVLLRLPLGKKVNTE